MKRFMITILILSAFFTFTFCRAESDGAVVINGTASFGARTIEANTIDANSAQISGTLQVGRIMFSRYDKTDDFTVTDTNYSQTFTNTGAAKNITATIPDANTAMLGKTFHFRDVNATYSIIIAVDANSTLYDTSNSSLLTEGQDFTTGAGRGSIDIIYEEPNIIWLYYGGTNADAL